MDFTTFLWTTLGAFLTLATFSFLYKDNPFYKLAEHLVVGVSAGYFVIIVWHGTMVPNLFQKLADGDWFLLWLNSTQPWYIVPGILGILMWTRFSRKYGSPLTTYRVPESVIEDYEVFGMPTLVGVDEHGVTRFVSTGYMPLIDADFLRASL